MTPHNLIRIAFKTVIFSKKTSICKHLNNYSAVTGKIMSGRVYVYVINESKRSEGM